MTDFYFMRRRRTSVRWASRLPGPRLKEASDASDERGHIGEIIFIGFDGKPLCVGVNFAGGRNEFTGRNGRTGVLDCGLTTWHPMGEKRHG